MTAPLSVKQAAAVLGISPSKVYELARAGKVAHYRFETVIKFEHAAIDAFKASCRQPCRAPPPTQAAPALSVEPKTQEVYELLHQAPTKQELRKQRKAIELRRKQIRTVLARHHGAKRRAVKLQRTPAWVDLKSVRAMHEQAVRLTAETGIVHHVDHIYPLQGKLVSGLHVHQNMQVLTGSENSSKGNRYEVKI